MPTDRRRSAVAALLGLICALSMVAAAPSATADSRLVQDGEGEVETRYSVDRGRFTVGDKRVVATITYGRLVRRSSLGTIYMDLVPTGPGDEVLRASYSRRDGWHLFSRLDGGVVSGRWTHRFDFDKRQVRIAVPARHFGDARRFSHMSFDFIQYNRAFDRYDSVGAYEVRRG